MIELCRPFGACMEEGIPLIRRVPPYANLFRPFGACVLQTRDKGSSSYTQKKRGLFLVVLEKEVVVGVALDMDGFDAVVHQLFEGINVALLAGRDEDAVLL